MKYTVITGASSGIGYETALAFAKRGKNLVLVARREDKLHELSLEIAKINSEIDIVIRPVDLSQAKDAHELYESLKGFELETWINNAGFGNFEKVAEQNLNKVASMLNLNIDTLTILSTLFVRDYSDVAGTQLINVASLGGYAVVYSSVTYCATKFYVSAFTEGLAQELKADGKPMQVKVLAPGAVETEFAIRARDIAEFSYEENVAKFHTAKEMAEFMLRLYDGDKVLGLVNPETYDFTLMDPIHRFAMTTRG